MSDAIVPSTHQPIAGPGGIVTATWQRFFNALVGAPATIAPVTVGASPYTYTASQNGTLVVTGGTISAKTLTRNTVTISITSTNIPMANGDSAIIAYSVLPTVNFIPS